MTFDTKSFEIHGRVREIYHEVFSFVRNNGCVLDLVKLIVHGKRCNGP